MRFPILFFPFILIINAFAQNGPSAGADSLILHGIRQTFLCDFDGALNTFRKLADRDPVSPAGPFYLAATLQSKMMDAETNAWEAEFTKNIDAVIRTTEKMISEGNRDPQIFEYLGSAYNYKGLYEGKQGRLLKGFIHAHRGVGYLEKALALDSTLFDACAGVGNYKYWAGHFYKYLKWLPWIRDERDAGIRLIRKAVERGTYSRWVGVSSLGWIEYDRKNYREGIDLFDGGLREFPGSRFFLWGAADCAFGMKDYELSVRLYSQLFSSIRESAGQSGYNEAECLYKLMRAHEALGQSDAAAARADALLELKPAKEAESRIEKHRKAARKCRERFLEDSKKR
jgi:tetratricopeptide (TPR) repeat protein